MFFCKKYLKLIILTAILSTLQIGYISARVYFIEKYDDTVDGHELERPCILDYPLTICSNNKTPNLFCPTDSKYFKKCICEEKYKYTTDNCTENKSLSGNQCDNKYEICTCDTSKYKFDLTNCTPPKKMGTEYCGGKCSECFCPNEYSKDCSYPMVGIGEECDGKFVSCKCSQDFTECKYGPETASTESCTESDGTAKFKKCKTAPLTCENGKINAEEYWCDNALQYWIKK